MFKQPGPLLEDIDSELNAAQIHLHRQFFASLKNRVPHTETFGTEDLARDITRKMQSLDTLFDEYLLASSTRAGALQMLSLFPGEPMLKQSRTASVMKSILLTEDMHAKFSQCMAAEIEAMESLAEPMLKFAVASLIRSNEFSQRMKSIKNRDPSKTPFENLRSSVGDENIAPLLYKRKKILTAQLNTSLSIKESRISGLRMTYGSIESFQPKLVKPIRYLVEWQDGAPTQFREVKSSSDKNHADDESLRSR